MLRGPAQYEQLRTSNTALQAFCGLLSNLPSFIGESANSPTADAFAFSTSWTTSRVNVWRQSPTRRSPANALLASSR
jgi:gamma-glutamyl:cysteine ligase YbdK (ATP-grasp superfamily)